MLFLLQPHLPMSYSQLNCTNIFFNQQSYVQTLIKLGFDGSFIMLITLQGDSCCHLVIFIYCIMNVLCHLSFSHCEHFPIVDNKLLKLIETMMIVFTSGWLSWLFGCHYVDSLYISNVLLFPDHDKYTYVKYQPHQTTAINNMPQTGQEAYNVSSVTHRLAEYSL